MGGTDPIRALGIQAKVSQVTNTYAMPKGAQTELHSPHSISEQGLEMHVFHGNNVKWENNEIEEIMLSLQPHLNSTPTGPIQAFSELLPLSGNLVSG